MTLVLLIGGARSGKSRLAMLLAERHGGPVTFLATGAARDEEMAARIAAHRGERPAGWQTIEEPLHLERAMQGVTEGSCLIVDCLTFWTANALEAAGPDETERAARTAARVAAERSGLTIAVTNEVGMGVVPASALGRSYRDLLGRVNAIWAEAAAEALLAVAGRALALDRFEDVLDA